MAGAIDIFTVDAVYIRRQRYWENGYRPVAKWNPGAVDRNGEPIRNAGKASKGANWREHALENPPRMVRVRPDSDALGTAFLCDEFTPADVDVDDQELCDRVVALIEQQFGKSRLVRQGRAPKVALGYRAPKPFRRIKTAEMKVGSIGPVMPGPLGPGERKVCVEILGEGQSLTVDAIHPDTGEPYRWLDLHPLDVPLCDLLPIDEATAREVIEEAEKLLREAGAVDILPSREEKPGRERKSNGSDFFQRVNDWALRDRDCWIRQIFPQAKRQGNGAWRIPAVLRGLPASKQDISIHESGIRDFHEDRAMSPIDFTIQFGHGVYRGAAREAGCVQVKPENEDLFDCAFWLCRQLGISPADLGWRDHEGPPPYDELPEHCRGEPSDTQGFGRPPEPPPPVSAPEGPGGDLPVILVTGGHRHQAADRGLDALKRARVPLYVRDLEIVSVVPKLKTISKGTRISMPVIHRVGPAGLGRFAGQVARWHRYDQHGKLRRIDPPRPIIEQMMEMQSKWPSPPITGICGAPGLRPDFSLLNTEGYDAQTGLYCDFGGLKMPHIPTSPTRAQAETGLKLILEIVDTFPWVDQPSRAAMVSGMITPVVRGALDVVPMIVISARAPGTGKTYFVHLCAAIATGQKVPPIAMGSNAEEFEKRLVMAALEGRLIILIDNVRRVVQSDLLCQLTEQRLCNLRALGTSVAHEVVNNFCVSITGNNAQIAADLTRRGLRSLLDANMENPEQKQHKDPQLFEHVLQRRPELIAACLTVPLYYQAAGRPNALPRLASYGDWSDNIRSALVHLGLADPVETMSELRRIDPVRVRRAQVFAAWLVAMKSDLAIQADKHGDLTTGELVTLAETHPDLREALLEVADPKGTGRIDNSTLGKWLTREEGAIVLGHKLCCDRETNTQKPRWRLVARTEVEEQWSR